MSPPLLFCNIGWMNQYLGQTHHDKIIGGGKYVRVKSRGNEVCNFVTDRGKVYGFVQPVGDRIEIRKLGAEKGDNSIQGVDVVLTARRPGGNTVVVGWYRNATVYEKLQKLKRPTALHKKNKVQVYRFETTASNVKRLQPEERTLVVPRGKKGGMGQSNVWYANNAQETWLAQVRRLLSPQVALQAKPAGRKSSKHDHVHNTRVEIAAMQYVWSYYEKNGYSLKDVSKENRGWDLEASSGNLVLQIEVKGLSSSSPTIELTPNEYKAFSKKSHTYRLCIVTNALGSRPSLTTCKFNLASEAWAIDGDEHRVVKVKRHEAATITVDRSGSV